MSGIALAVHGGAGNIECNEPALARVTALGSRGGLVAVGPAGQSLRRRVSGAGARRSRRSSSL